MGTWNIMLCESYRLIFSDQTWTTLRNEWIVSTVSLYQCVYLSHVLWWAPLSVEYAYVFLYIMSTLTLYRKGPALVCLHLELLLQSYSSSENRLTMSLKNVIKTGLATETWPSWICQTCWGKWKSFYVIQNTLWKAKPSTPFLKSHYCKTF